MIVNHFEMERVPRLAGWLDEARDDEALGVVFTDAAPVYYETPLWEALGRWCIFHHLDWQRIPQGAVVTRDAPRRRILTTYYEMDGDLPKFDERDHIITHPHIEQGEAPPLPFPDPAGGDRWHEGVVHG